MKQNKSELSELRKEMHELLAELQRLLSVLSSRKPMLRGTVYVLRRRCGKERCRCCDGELHQTEVFSCTEGGVRVIAARITNSLLGRAGRISIAPCFCSTASYASLWCGVVL